MSEVMEAVELAFKQKGIGRVQMPAKLYLYFSKYNGDLRTMPSYLEELEISAVKIVNVHPDNPSKHKLPTVMAVIVLVDPSTGIPLAIMGGTTVTNMRTGAAGGIAAKFIARNDSKIVGLVGGLEEQLVLLAKMGELTYEALSLSMHGYLQDGSVISQVQEMSDTLVAMANKVEAKRFS